MNGDYLSAPFLTIQRLIVTMIYSHFNRLSNDEIISPSSWARLFCFQFWLKNLCIAGLWKYFLSKNGSKRDRPNGGVIFLSLLSNDVRINVHSWVAYFVSSFFFKNGNEQTSFVNRKADGMLDAMTVFKGENREEQTSFVNRLRMGCRSSQECIFIFIPLLNILFLSIVFAIPISLLSAQSTLIRPLKLNDIVYNPANDRIYAAAPGELKEGNAIFIIHPNTGLVEEKIPVGSEPTVLRFSDNFQYLYIGYIGLNELHRYDLLNKKLETIATLKSKNERLYITEILPVPKEPEKVIVALRANGIVVFDGFTQLPEIIAWHEREKDSRNLIADPQTGRIFGFGHHIRIKGLIEYEVTERGIAAKEIYEDILHGKYSEIEIHNGKLYTQVGQVIDLNQDPPAHIFEVQNAQDPISSKVLEVDPGSGLIYKIDFLAHPLPREEYGYYFCTIDPTNFQQINSKQLNGYDFEPKKLIYTGVPGRFAAISEYTLGNKFPTSAQFSIFGACQEEASPQRLTILQDKEEYCWLDTATLIVTGNYENYYWSTGSTENLEKIIQIPLVRGQSREVSVAVINEKGCTVAQSDSIEIKVNFPPTDFISISGSQLLCPNDSILLTARTEEGSKNGFLWSTGDTTISIYITEPGTYSVQNISGPNCVTYEPACYTVIYHPERNIPKAKIEALGDTEFCSNDYLRLRAVEEQDYYVWNGATVQDREISVVRTGFQKLQYADENGCLGEADSIWTSILPAPPKAIIRSFIQYRIYNNTPYKKQWFFNGEPLPINADTIYTRKRGFYHLGYIGANGCMSELSIEKRVVFPYIEEGVDGLIKGRVWLDTNKNGRLDSLDRPYSNARIKLNVDNQVTFTNREGLFRFLIPRQAYEIQTGLDPTLWKAVIGENGYKDDFSTVASPFYNFLIQPVNAEPRLFAEIHSGIIRCNRKVPLWVSVSNVGNDSFSGDLCLAVNPKITTGVFQGDSISIPNGRFCWTIDSLGLGKSQNTVVSLDLPGVEAFGELFPFNFSVEKDQVKIAEDFYEDVFRCSYDPNDKQVAPRRGPEGQYALFEDELEYTIRFQNTGNDTAFTVLLKDELSTDLDWNSFFPVAASHDYEVNLNATNGNLEILFDNILLPDSTTNVVGSQGFFSYKIRPNEGLAEQTLIENKAGIFFDLNPPIITNTVISNMVSEIPVTTPTEEVIKEQATFLFAPNPHQKNITLFLNDVNADVRLTIYNVLGKEMYTANILNATNQWTINTSDWETGTYFYKILEIGGTELLGKGKLIKF